VTAKIHYWFYYVIPSESDLDGEGVVACGLEGVDATDRVNEVTCENCLRYIAARSKESKGAIE
jgi:hypothetical protein